MASNNKNSELQEVDLAAATTGVYDDVESGRQAATATPVVVNEPTTNAATSPTNKLTTTTTTTTEDERTWAMIAHLSVFSGFIIPFGNIIGPLLVMLCKGNDDGKPFAHRHAKESLNFQIMFTIYTIIAIVLTFVVIGIIILPILFILEIVFVVIASMKANKGEEYEYPLLCCRFIK